jgi:hypothetical protein
MRLATPVRFLSCASVLGALLIASASTLQAQCLPASCTGTPGFVSFESQAPGDPIEGLGTLHPQLAITGVPWSFSPTCAAGSAAVIAEGGAPFSCYNTGGVDNACLTGLQGYGDPAACVLDYDFTFAAGVTVSCFSMRMLDYGDFFPFGGTTHQVVVTAYDAANNVVDTDVLTIAGGEQLTTGDACTASHNGDPGNKLFTVTGAGIVKVTLRFDAWPDPNVGFDDISFCSHVEATPARTRSWGQLKTLYRP